MLLHIEIVRISILRQLGPPHVNIFVQLSHSFAPVSAAMLLLLLALAFSPSLMPIKVLLAVA